MRLYKGMMGKNGWVKRTNRKCRRESRSRKIKNGGVRREQIGCWVCVGAGRVAGE